MQKKPLSDVIKKLIDSKTTTADNISNLHGSPALSPVVRQTEGAQALSEWQVYFTDSTSLVSPSEILDKVLASYWQRAPIIKADRGVIKYTTGTRGATLLSTAVVIPRATSIPATIYARGCSIAVYAGGSLVRRGADRLAVSVAFPAGITPFEIVIVGPPSEVMVTIPDDVFTSVTAYIPPEPIWRSPVPIETNYVDPKSGNTGNALYWANQSNVGGWGVYKTSFTQYGVITSIGYSKEYISIHTTEATSAPPVPSYIRVGNYVDSGTVMLGIATYARIDSGTGGSDPTELYLRVSPGPDFITLDYASGTALEAVEFIHLHDVVKLGSDPYVSFVDTNVKIGETYSYTLDSFSVIDRAIRSQKSVVKSVVAGDVTPPGSVTILSSSIAGGIVTIRYHTPADEDYAGTHVYYDNVSSGTMDSIIVDFGLPDKDDSVSFAPVDSGTFYLATFDKAGNEQYVASGEPFIWDGTGLSVSNMPPTLKVRQYSSAEVVSAGGDPYKVAIFEVDADDDLTAHSALELDYRMPGDGSWTTISGVDLPSGLLLARDIGDNWIRARAYDGSLYSDELTFLVDYDTNPEVVSLLGEYVAADELVYVTGTVDDDTKSIQWYVSSKYTGPEAGEPTSASPTTIDNLDGTKVFTFDVAMSEGKRKVIVVNPYPDLAAGGQAGQFSQLDFGVPPKTHASLIERTLGGSVSRTEALVTLAASPENAVIYNKLSPIDFGIVDSGLSAGLYDGSKSWTVDGYNTNYEVAIVAGTGKGQTRTITDTTATVLTVSPAWSTVPANNSHYRISERYQLFNDSGNVTALASDEITDATKSWITNQFYGRKITFTDGPATGFIRTVVGNDNNTITVYPAWEEPYYAYDWFSGTNGTAIEDYIPPSNASYGITDYYAVSNVMDIQNLQASVPISTAAAWDVQSTNDVIRDNFIIRCDYTRPNDNTSSGYGGLLFRGNGVSKSASHSSLTFLWQPAADKNYVNLVVQRQAGAGTAEITTLVTMYNWAPNTTKRMYARVEGDTVTCSLSDTDGSNFITFNPKTFSTGLNDSSHQRVGFWVQSGNVARHYIDNLYVTALGIAPTVGDPYYTYGARVISKDTDYNKMLSFYSEMPGIIKEEPHSIIIDADSLPEIESLSMIEIEASKMQVSIINPDDDVKTWTFYCRKGGWPTIDSGNSDTAVVQDYKTYIGTINDTEFQMDLSTGVWFGIAVPYDSFGNVGERVTASLELTDSATTDPALYNVSVAPLSGWSYERDSRNRISWNHNSVAEKPGGGDGTVEVMVYAYRSDVGPPYNNIYQSTRYAWQDSDDGDPESNADDTTNSLSGQGSLVHAVDRTEEKYVTWYYKVELYDADVLINTYTTSHSGWYSNITQE